VNSPGSSSRGEHRLPGCFSLESTPQHRRPHAREPRAAPFGAGRRGSSTRLPEPLEVCACRSATRRGRSRTKRCPVARSRAAPGKHRRAPLCSGVLTAVRRLQATRAVRSRTGGPDQNGAYHLASVHHGPVSRAHSAVHHRCYRWIKDPRPNRAIFFKDP
jgi:hypothetical protein